MITVQREALLRCKAEIAVLAEEHTHEINRTRSKTKLEYNPPHEGWDAVDSLGLLHAVTVRDDDRLVGYGLLLLAPDMSNKDVTICKCEILFMHKNYRGATSLKLLNKLESTAKEVGADYYVCGVKPDADYSKYLLRRGFAKDETFYIKHIKGG